MKSFEFKLMDDSLRKAFSDECDELLERMEHVLLEVESDPKNHALIDELFRIVHTIKGSSGLVGFDQLVHFSHELENLAVQVREGALEVTQQLCDIMLESRDLLSALVDMALGREITETLETLQARETELIARIKVFAPQLGDAPNPALGGAVKSAASMSTSHATPQNSAVGATPGPTDSPEPHASDADDVESLSEYCIEVNLEPEVLMFGLDPMASILYLQELGEIKECLVETGELPPFSEIDFTKCYLNFKIVFESSRALQDIEDAFMFLQENSTIQITDTTLHANAQAETVPAYIQQSAEEADAASSPANVGTVQAEKDKDTGASSPGPTQIPKASNPPAPRSVANANETVRVDAKKLENLIDLVGELVIANANTHLLAKNGEADLLMDATDAMLGLVEDIRDTTLSLRMVQIGTVFNRYKRVVREVSQELGKGIDLVITGGDTELDKTIVDKISDPLMHMIRNAVDHGVESPEERRAAGKPERGTVKLNAYHDSGVIVIEIIDDGKGIIKENILARAESRGIISDRRLVPDRSVYDLIFYPGFSTAEKVTNLSGRGVGMDVVKKNIDALNGQIDVESEPGAYTKISIRLPLTLAIIDGFLFEVAGLNYVVPLDMVDECVEFSDENNANYVDTQFFNLRGEIMPFMRLKDFFEVRGVTAREHDFKDNFVVDPRVLLDEPETSIQENGADSAGGEPTFEQLLSTGAPSLVRLNELNKSRRESVIVIRSGNSKSGIVVDKLLGEYQTVIKPVGRVFKNLEWLSGATILGNGDVAIIIDVLMLIKHVFVQIGDDERWMTQEAS